MRIEGTAQAVETPRHLLDQAGTADDGARRDVIVAVYVLRGHHSGLVIAEIELDNEAQDFEKPG